MEASILKTIKEMLGVQIAAEEFDSDIITHINSSFSVLQQLGVGPQPDGYMIEDDTAEWADYLPAVDGYNEKKL